MDIAVIVYRNENTRMVTGEVVEDPHKACKIAEQLTKIAEGGKVQVLNVQAPFEI